jgi:hypothetical protein
MSNITYQLHSSNILLGSSFRNLFLRDSENNSAYINQRLEAQIRSGDYFVTLATELDSLASNTTNSYDQSTLENIISDLMYLQDNYEVKKK